MRTLLFSGSCLALGMFIATQSLFAADCDRAIGRVDGILVNGSRIDEVPNEVVSLLRKAKPVPVKNGLPVCSGDVISTSNNASLTVRLGDSAELENQITIYAETTTQLLTSDSVFVKLGRLFASLRAPFTAGTVFGSLGARGTTFEVEVSTDNATVLQLEGSVEFNPETSELSAPPLRVSPKLLPAALIYQERQLPKSATGPARKTGGGLTLAKLTRMTITHGQSPKSQGLPIGVCNDLIEKNDREIVATRAKIPSRPVTTEIGGKAGLYETTRPKLVCDEKNDALQELASVYTAWNQSADAVYALELARQHGALRPSDPVALNDIGNAYRLAGDLKAAIQFYQSALQRDPRFAFPYNGLGDVSRDSALIAYAHADTVQARTNLEQAKQQYQRSLGANVWGKEEGKNRAIALYNLGDTNLLLATLQPDNPNPFLDESTNLFRQALQQSDYPFAQLGLARVELIRAQLVRRREVAEGGKIGETIGATIAEGVRVHQEKKPFLDRAQKLVKILLERYPGFSAALETLGEIIEEGGNRGAAGKEFLQAIEFDPHNAIAYLRYSRTLRNRDESRIYAQVGRQIEPSSVAEINDGRIKISQPPQQISDDKIVLTPSESDQRERKNQSSGSVSVTQLEFRDVDPSKTKSVVFTNSGPGSLKISSVAVQGNATVFRVTRDGCSHRELGVNHTCTILVTVNGAGTSRAEGSVLINHDGSNSPQSVRLLWSYAIQ